MDLTNINDVKALLGRHGFHFSKSMGQNFLVESWVPHDIALSSDASGETAVLEIGPGIGPLTVELAKRAGKVIAVELDHSLQPILNETLAGYDNVSVVYDDITKIDCAQFVQTHFVGFTPIVCANLPYNITTPVITQFLESGSFASITVMIQREVAKRICAVPGTADYGAFTLLCQYYADCEYLFEVPKECFIPQPKVTSAVVRLKIRNAPPVTSDKALLFRVIRAAFAQRRKTLSNALSSGFHELNKESIRSCLIQCGYPETIRGEKLSLRDFAALTDAISPLI